MILTVEEKDRGMRLDRFLPTVLPLSRSAAALLCGEGRVLVGGTAADKKRLLCPGDVIEVCLPEPKQIEAVAQDIPLSVVYEDEHLLVINKPSGMVVHPAPGNEDGTLVNALLFHCGEALSGINGALRPGIVHRIDKDTSGLLVVAKSDGAHRALSLMLETHAIVREYHALVSGGFAADGGTVNAPIGRHPADRKKMAVLRPGEGTSRTAVTHYTVRERFGEVSYLTLRLETGRTHQIRVHMTHIGHPLLGDPVYGTAHTAFERRHPALFDGQMLHAATLSFTHPKTGEPMTFHAPLPDNFTRALELLRAEAEG